jgi:hypothetical protein
MRADDEARLERIRREAQDAALADPRSEEPGATSIVVQTTPIVAYPAGGPKFYGCRRVEISGDDSEGAAVTLTPVGEKFTLAQLLNATIPDGTYLVVDRLGGLWATAYS